MRALFLLPALLLLPAAAFAQEAPGAPKNVDTCSPEEAREIVRAASNAFEYRDFAQVVALLNPCLHPPKITDAELLEEARRLMGIALHVQGEVESAKKEFELLLSSDPDVKLDPFLVPPAVIETFEDVRRQMAPVLDRLRSERPEPKPTEPIQIEVPSPLIAYAPFGIPQLFVLDQTEWGLVWLGLQVAGLALNITSFWIHQGLREDGPTTRGFFSADVQSERDVLTALQYTGLGVFALSWIGSGIQGHYALESYTDRIRATAAEQRAKSIELSLGPGEGGLMFRLSLPLK